MGRAWTLCLGIALVGGCRTPVPIIDPFEGRTRVAPPGTGDISAFTPADPYYNRGGSGPTASLAPRLGEESRVANNATGGAASPGLGPLEFRPNAARPNDPNAAANGAPSDGGSRSYDERPGARWGSELPARPLGDTRGAQPIAPYGGNLPSPLSRGPLAAPPPPGSGGAGWTSGAALPARPAAAPAGNVRPTGYEYPPPAGGSWEEPSAMRMPGRTTQDPFVPSASAQFERRPGAAAGYESPQLTSGYAASTRPDATIWRGAGGAASAAHAFYVDRNYSVLRGQLEYSRVQRVFKLRYIPISGDSNGQTDTFGGSVVLEDTPALSGFQDGEYVEAQGFLRQGPGGQGYAPVFALRTLRRQ